MRKYTEKRRGFTLTELAVVLAVLAIVTTMIVSFNALVSNRRAVSQARLDALNDIKVAEAVIENYIEKNGTSADISFADHVLTVGTRTVTLERVTNITFDTQGEADTIYFCTLEYTIPGQAAPESYTFCVYPYVGEAIGGAG